MLAEAVQKLADAGAGRGRFLAENPRGFRLSAMMAGIYVAFGILLVFRVGSLVDPSVRPLVMGATFGLPLILVFAGSELDTGLTMSMPLAALERKTNWNTLGAVWAAGREVMAASAAAPAE